MLLLSKLAGAEELFIHPLKKSDVFTNYFLVVVVLPSSKLLICCCYYLIDASAAITA
jgi:hypothetical protein